MMLSLDSYYVLRITIAKAILDDPDNPRLRRAYHELKAAVVDDNRRALESTHLPMFLRRQAD